VAEPAVLERQYSYPFASEIASVAGRPQLALAASNSPIAERLFFAGALHKPEIPPGRDIRGGASALLFSLKHACPDLAGS
jgi:hypothetical protein